MAFWIRRMHRIPVVRDRWGLGMAYTWPRRWATITRLLLDNLHIRNFINEIRSLIVSWHFVWHRAVRSYNNRFLCWTVVKDKNCCRHDNICTLPYGTIPLSPKLDQSFCRRPEKDHTLRLLGLERSYAMENAWKNDKGLSKAGLHRPSKAI